MPGRSDIEIGKHLKNAVPDKFLHLINHLQTSDHEAMMKILEEKFGQGSLVIQDIFLQIERMKPVINDKGFVSFVEKS